MSQELEEEKQLGILEHTLTHYIIVAEEKHRASTSICRELLAKLPLHLLWIFMVHKGWVLVFLVTALTTISTFIQ